jgi:hypothetical protein
VQEEMMRLTEQRDGVVGAGGDDDDGLLRRLRDHIVVGRLRLRVHVGDVSAAGSLVRPISRPGAVELWE